MFYTKYFITGNTYRRLFTFQSVENDFKCDQYAVVVVFCCSWVFFCFCFCFCFVLLFFFGGGGGVCLTSQQHVSVSQGRICSDKCCCHTEIEVAHPTFYLTQAQYTDTGPTSPSTDPITPGAWQGSHWSANFYVTGMTRTGKTPSRAGFEPRIFRSGGGCLNH